MEKKADNPELAMIDTSFRNMGKSLLEEAVKKHHKLQGEIVQQQVYYILERITVLDRLMEKTERRMQLCRDQVKAIEEGHFTLDHHMKLKFDNPDLNVDWNLTESW